MPPEFLAVGRVLRPHGVRGELLLEALADSPGPLNDVDTVYLGEAAPPPPGSYYHHQSVGLAVVTEEGEALGEVTEILETGSNDVYVVSGPSGEILLPALTSVILKVDLEAKRMTVHLLEGLR